MGTAPDIILIGASVRSLAVSAIRDGLRPLCIDLFGDADLAELLEGCAGQLLRVNQFEDVPSALAGCRQKLPVVLSGGIENQSSLVRTLSEHYPIAGPGLEAIESVRNPAKLFATLARCGCCVPAWYDSSHRLSVANRTNVRWLTKVRLSSGGTGVSLGNDITDADNQYVQEFVDGTLVSATFFSLAKQHPGNAVLLGSAIQLSGSTELNAPPFYFCGNVGPVRLSEQFRRQVVETGTAVAREFRLDGVFGIDFILNKDGLWALEVNPRITASHELHEWANRDQPGHVSLQTSTITGIEDSVVSMLASINRRNPDPVWGRYILYAEKDLQICSQTASQLIYLTSSYSTSELDELPVFLADVPTEGSTVFQGTPFCSVYLNLNLDWKSHLAEIERELAFAGRYLLGKLAEKIQGQYQTICSNPEITK